MPNWCENKLKISGPKELVQQIVDARFSLETLCPPPKEEVEEDWYTAHCKHWGTKWDPGPVEGIVVKEKKNGKLEAHIFFSSAWSPPVEALGALFRKYDGKISLRLKYLEGGMCFIGESLVKPGFEGVRDRCFNFTSAKELESLIESEFKGRHRLGKNHLEVLKDIEEEVQEEKRKKEMNEKSESFLSKFALTPEMLEKLNKRRSHKGTPEWEDPEDPVTEEIIQQQLADIAFDEEDPPMDDPEP